MKTRERILHTSLALFNELGEPNVTTLLIADELEISPGNLYYHYKSKTDIIDALFKRYEEAMYGILVVPESDMEIEDLWFFLHLVFENIAKFQFLYKDPVTLMSKYPHLHNAFQKVLLTKRKACSSVLKSAQASGRLHASAEELQALTDQIILITTFWLSYSTLTDNQFDEGSLARGIYQVLSVAAPFLEPERRAMIDALKDAYL